MRNARAHRFTIFDVMEARGVFEDNPANAESPEYKGPLKYPMMFYHPKGLERVTQRAEVVVTPLGPERVGELKEIVTRTARDEEEEGKLRKEGWHDHPSKAMAAGGRDAPPIATDARVEALEARLAALQKELEDAKAVAVPEPKKDEAEEERLQALIRGTTR